MKINITVNKYEFIILFLILIFKEKMKFHVLMYLANITKDIIFFIRNYKSKNKNKFLFYSSEIVEKIELSGELIYEIIFHGKKINLFQKKKIFLLICELIRAGCKFRELRILSGLGYDFYIEKNIYLEQILDISDEDFVSKLGLIE